MTGFLGWLASTALLVVIILAKKNFDQKIEQAIITDLFLDANRSLELSEVLNTALDGLLALLEMSAGAVHLYDPEKDNMGLFVQKGYSSLFSEMLTTVPIESPVGLIARAVNEKKPIFLSEIRQEVTSPFLQEALKQGMKSAACIPLFVRDEPIATLLVSSRKRVRFHKNKVSILTNFGHALGLAVEKARLYEQVTKKTQQLAVINEITKTINSSLDIPAIYENFAKKIKDVLDYDRCVIVLADKDRNSASVFLLATPHETKLTKGKSISTLNTSLEWVAKHKRAHFEKDLAKEQLFKEDEMLYKEGIRSTVRLPIWVKNEMAGVFILDSKIPHRYSESDLEILEPITENLALALDKYLLFRQISSLSMTDELTGCGNRRLLHQEMEREIKRADRYSRHLALLLLDIDYFKNINDSLGHLAGDQILKELAELMYRQIRDIDTCIRYGGEEFLIILPETDLEGAVSTAEKLRLAVENTFFKIQTNVYNITISVGIAVYPQHAASSTDLIQRADLALYRAKSTGRNQTFVFADGPVQMPSLFTS